MNIINKEFNNTKIPFWPNKVSQKVFMLKKMRVPKRQNSGPKFAEIPRESLFNNLQNIPPNYF